MRRRLFEQRKPFIVFFNLPSSFFNY